MGRTLKQDGSTIARAEGDGSQDPAVDFEDLRQKLLRTITHVCPPWLADQREDIAQVALMRVMKVSQEGESNPARRASYLWKVAYSATVDHIRKLRRRREVPLEDGGPDAGPEAEGETDPFAEQALGELGLAIRECLATISESRRLAVGLHLMGHTVSEMTTLLHGETKRVRNLLFRGMNNLRTCLLNKGFAP